MKRTYVIATAIIGAMLASPVMAHHNSPWGEDGIEIGDMLGMHDAAYDRVSQFDVGNSDMPDMDPADSNMPDEIDPQPNGVNIPDDGLPPGSGPVSGPR